MNDAQLHESLPGFRRGRENLGTIKKEAQRNESISERLADIVTAFSGSMIFVYIHVAWFLIWITWNTGLLGLPPFDPFPFGLLTMIVSLEAIFLSTFVLISQNREQKVNAVRDEIDTQVNLYQEQELTQVLRIVHRIEKHLGLQDDDEACIRDLERYVNPDDLFHQIEQMVLKRQ
ncbi:MAG: DUF1003 domain-containing protein [Chloroflexi bacterium]|nr:DUF1003 domain-containing protein [Chloroflexota bacterium]